MVVLLVADGARGDVVHRAIDRGQLPALARMRAEGGAHTITSVFPSVTGPAYTPFLMGRFPGAVGIPGLRWFDRTRTTCSFPDYSRSYVGAELRHLAHDLDGTAPTIFELAGRNVATMSMVMRGLRRDERLDGGVAFMARTARTHFRGDAAAWLEIDRDMGDRFAERVREQRPSFALAAFMSIDKLSHARGHDCPGVVEGLRLLDDTAARVREDAERLGYWSSMQLWVVSDHGHSPIHGHDDLADWLRELGIRVRAHPWVFGRADAALMVSGNAMAHLYLDISRRRRPWWRGVHARWSWLADALLERPSVELLLVPLSEVACEVRSARGGRALVERRGARVRHVCITGDPLGLGDTPFLDAEDAHALTRDGEHPDVLVQVASLAGAARAGDLIVSAAPGWDFRAHYEPIPHVSSHGSLRREHMLVPFLHAGTVRRAPHRTTDLMPSALDALGLAPPLVLDGRSFL